MSISNITLKTDNIYLPLKQSINSLYILASTTLNEIDTFCLFFSSLYTAHLWPHN